VEGDNLMDIIARKITKNEKGFTQLLIKVMRIINEVTQKHFVASTLFMRPENVILNREGCIKIRLADYHLFNERPESHPPIPTHVVSNTKVVLFSWSGGDS